MAGLGGSFRALPRTRPTFYTPGLARRLRLRPTVWYDRTFDALRGGQWAGGHHAAAEQLARLARDEVRDMLTAARALINNPRLGE